MTKVAKLEGLSHVLRAAPLSALVIFVGCSDPADSKEATSLIPRSECVTVEGDGGTVDFFSEILPILSDRCVRCHGGVRELGSPRLNLQSRERAAFVLGEADDPCSSELFRRIAIADPDRRMPFDAPPLSPDEVSLMARWIRNGAPWPKPWAFAPLAKPDPAELSVSNEAWIKTPIDRFILHRLDKKGMLPSPEAERTTLLRRVFLDLTGIPPAIADVDAFMADTSDRAYENVVDRLLQSPRFGEAWGRHWLDQARYADSEGYERDPPRPNAWRWRDWVIDAFNRDVPFDQFTIEQLAGDLLPDAKPTQILGTGFHRQAMFNREDGVDPEEDRTKRVIDRVATVGTTWLGLTLGCAQCHSHTYDPISQKEFYKLYAFFNNANEANLVLPKRGNVEGGDADVMAENTDRPTYLFVRGNFLTPDQGEELIPGTPAILYPFQSQGRRPTRLDLARWIVDPRNPLPPRVAVNTIWYHLFGRGIVATLEDFGSRAQLPSHPELLDWLADDFVSHGWLRKRFIKQIVMSSTYRQSAAVRPDLETGDVENVFLARQNRIRVPAETVIDTSLAASGLLAPKDGGPCVYPPVPPELLTITHLGIAWPTSQGEDRHRRALYTFHQRSVPYPQLRIFDRPSAASSVTGRRQSNTPLQALTMMHNSVFVEAAQALARRAQTEKAGDAEAQIVFAFRLALGRVPEEKERAVLRGLFSDFKGTFESDSEAATKLVGDYLPDGVPVATAAAMVVTAQVILNLDEVITRE
jgi:hypothetical protein